MPMITTSVDAATMRTTKETLPGYAASSSLRKPQSQVDVRAQPERLCAMESTSPPSDDDDGRFADSKQPGRWVLHTHANRIARGEMHPVESALYIGQTRLEAAHNVCVWSHAESDTVYNTRKTDTRLRHDVYVRPRARRDMFELTFAKVGDSPPGAGVNEREYLLPDMRVSPL